MFNLKFNYYLIYKLVSKIIITTTMLIKSIDNN